MSMPILRPAGAAWQLVTRIGLAGFWLAGPPIVAVAMGGCQKEQGTLDEAHWGYSGDVGPDHWAELDQHYALAAAGREQSPIDLSDADATPIDLPPIEVHYEPADLDIVNNGHTILLSYDKGGWIRVDGIAYRLVQIHFHSPSEHTISGERFPMEMHLVHQDEGGELAVIAVLIETGEHHPNFDRILQYMPRKTGERRVMKDVMVRIDRVLPDDWMRYRYRGSLTTPPCTEGVQWVVFRERIELSPTQIAEFQSVFNGNNRPVQPLNDRVVRTGR